MQTEAATPQWRLEFELCGRSIVSITHIKIKWNRIFTKIKRRSVHQLYARSCTIHGSETWPMKMNRGGCVVMCRKKGKETRRSENCWDLKQSSVNSHQLVINKSLTEIVWTWTSNDADWVKRCHVSYGGGWRNTRLSKEDLVGYVRENMNRLSPSQEHAQSRDKMEKYGKIKETLGQRSFKRRNGH